MGRITVGLAGLGVVSALALVGCGGGGGDTNAVSIKTLQLASENTQSAESMQYEIDLKAAEGSAHITGVSTGDGSRSQVVMETGSGRRTEERIVDGVLYADLSGLSLGDEPPGGKNWVEIDLNGLGEALGRALPSMPGGTSSADGALGVLQQISGDVQRVGDDTVAGRPAVHYQASADAGGRVSGPVDVWIDEHDRVVKLHLVDSTTGSEISMQITQFDVPVNVDAPPPDQVSQLADLLPGGLGKLLPGGDGHTI